MNVATLDSITQIVFLHTPGVTTYCSLKVTASQYLPLAPLHAVDNLYGLKKGQCDLWLAQTKSLAKVQPQFGNEFRSKRPHMNNIRRWFEHFKETEGVCKPKWSGRYAVTEARIQLFLIFFLLGVHQEEDVRRKNKEICNTWGAESAQLLTKSHQRCFLICGRKLNTD